MSLEGIEVIGAVGCPFVQGVVGFLIEKSIPFSYKNVDLKNKPAWFLEISPFGKVPVVRFPDGRVLFESVVIMEYLDDLLPPEQRLSPTDPFRRAHNKAWIGYFASILQQTSETPGQVSETDFLAALDRVPEKWATFAKEIKGRYFNNDNGPSLFDLAVTPILMRYLGFEDILRRDIGKTRRFPKLTLYMNVIRFIPSMTSSYFLITQTDNTYDPLHNIKALYEVKPDPGLVHEKILTPTKQFIIQNYPKGYVNTEMF